MPNYPLIQMGCVSCKRATRVTVRCCPAPTGSQCQGREGVAEISERGTTTHIHRIFPLSRKSAAGAIARLLSSSSSRRTLPARRRVPSLPPFEAYVAASPRCPILLSPHPLPPTTSRSDYTSGYTPRMAASLAPSNQKPIIRVFTSRVFCNINFNGGTNIASKAKIARSSTHACAQLIASRDSPRDNYVTTKNRSLGLMTRSLCMPLMV